MSGSDADRAPLFPLEFFIEGVPISLGASGRSKTRWKTVVADAARKMQDGIDQSEFQNERALALTLYYFPSAPMQGDIDNILKPVLDALIGVAYPDDNRVERVVSQKFEPEVGWTFSSPSERLAAVLDVAPPVLYIRIDDDLSWRLQ